VIEILVEASAAFDQHADIDRDTRTMFAHEVTVDSGNGCTLFHAPEAQSPGGARRLRRAV
jgi:hypothetical protein